MRLNKLVLILKLEHGKGGRGSNIIAPKDGGGGATIRASNVNPSQPIFRRNELLLLPKRMTVFGSQYSSDIPVISLNHIIHHDYFDTSQMKDTRVCAYARLQFLEKRETYQLMLRACLSSTCCVVIEWGSYRLPQMAFRA